jgi:hypothetical protein
VIVVAAFEAVLLGFRFQAFFQDGCATLSASEKYLSLRGLVLTLVSMALLVAMQHRLVERGEASQRLLRTTTCLAAASLVPLAMRLAVATYVVSGPVSGHDEGRGHQVEARPRDLPLR